MSEGHVLIVLAVATVTLAAAAALRRLGVPIPVVLVVAGLVIGFLPFVPDATLDPKLVLDGFLPILVYQASFESSPRALWQLARPIGALAVGLVAVTAGLVAVVAHVLGGLSWPMAFVLGTALGPTDSVAVTSIGGRMGLPRRLTSLLSGEALLNDGVSLVLYSSAVAAATSGTFSVWQTGGRVIYGAVVGVAVGLAMGVAARFARRRLDDPPMEIALSLLVAYVAYLPAEALGASGVLAAVTAGLYLGWHSSDSSSARSRLQSEAFWSTLIFLVDGALFILVGLSFHTFTVATSGPLARLVGVALAVVGVVIAARLVYVVVLPEVVRRRPRRRRPSATGETPATREMSVGPAPTWQHRTVAGWSGMRGGVTLAAVLAVPITVDGGRVLAGRDDVIAIAFAVIFVTLVVQGLTLPTLVRRLGVDEHPSVADRTRAARLALFEVALDVLDGVVTDGGGPGNAAVVLRAQYQARAEPLRAHTDGGPTAPASEHDGAERALRRQVLAAQRGVLADLRGQGRIGMATFRALQRELDLDEARIRA